jgi:hypothetical protein
MSFMPPPDGLPPKLPVDQARRKCPRCSERICGALLSYSTAECARWLRSLWPSPTPHHHYFLRRGLMLARECDELAQRFFRPQGPSRYEPAIAQYAGALRALPEDLHAHKCTQCPLGRLGGIV